jgi:hypothetical protein
MLGAAHDVSLKVGLRFRVSWPPGLPRAAVDDLVNLTIEHDLLLAEIARLEGDRASAAASRLA